MAARAVHKSCAQYSVCVTDAALRGRIIRKWPKLATFAPSPPGGGGGTWEGKEKMKSIKKLGGFACVAALALTLLGCGGTTSTTTSGSSAGSAAAGSGSESAYTLVEDGKLIGVSDMAYPPLESIPEGQSDPEGFEIDLMDAVAQKLGLQMEWLPATKWPTVLQAITSPSPAAF